MSESPRLAQAPFDPASRGADVILRTSDHVDFRAHKIILSLASPIFADMFDIPHPSQALSDASPGADWHDGLPVVQLSEGSDALDRVLRLCYPTSAPNIPDVKALGHVLEALQKYEIGIGVDAVAVALQRILKIEPVGVYAIALRTGQPSLATRAARATLTLPAKRLDSPELASITGADFRSLLKFHHRCEELVGEAAAASKFIPGGHIWVRINASTQDAPRVRFRGSVIGYVQRPPEPAHCAERETVDGRGQRQHFSSWWLDFLDAARSKLQEIPHRSTLSMAIAEPFLLRADECSTCRPRAREDMARYLQELGDRIDVVTNEVTLDLAVSS